MPDGENTDEVKAKDARWPFVLPFLFVLGGIFGMARAAIFEAQRLGASTWCLVALQPRRPHPREAGQTQSSSQNLTA
jgi:sirohydrochlorin ferrochelatase